MTAVGLLAPANRRTIRGAQNPLDKSTVVSIYPKEIHEVKETIQPGTFYIPPGSYDKPSILVIGTSSWWKELDGDQPLLEITNSSVQVAHSIVQDFSNGILACDMNESMPGLFFIPGEKTLEEVKKDHKGMLDRARDKQNNWFQALVRLGDSLWSRSSGNPLAIADTMRMAARELSLEKDWLANTARVETVRCIACGSFKNPSYPVCPVCRHIDQEMAKKLNLKFAE